MKNKVLIIVAHPDDEILGMGGTIQKIIESGKEVAILLLSQPGNARMDENPDIRLDIFKKIAQSLGIKKLYFKQYPDNSFDKISFIEIVKSIENVLDVFNANIIYTHFYNDLNNDHCLVSKAVITAARPFSKYEFIKKILMFEVPSSTELSIGKDQFYPNKYENITEYIENKINLFSLYNSELNNFPHPRSLEGIKTLAMYRGMQSGLDYAEAFILYKDID